MYTFIVAAIFVVVIPTYGVLPYAMILGAPKGTVPRPSENLGLYYEESDSSYEPLSS